MDLLKKSAFASLWQIVSLVGSFILNTVLMGVLARLILPEAFGLIAMANSVINTVQLFADIGIGQYIIRTPKLNNRILRCVFTVSLILSVIFGLIILILAPLVAAWYKESDLTNILMLIALASIIRKLGNVSESLLYKEMRFKDVAIIELTTYFIGYGVIGTIAALNGLMEYAIVYGLLVKTLLYVLACFIRKPYPLKPYFDKKIARDVFSFGGGIFLSTLVGAIGYQFPTFYIGRSLGGTSVGFYERLNNIAIMPVSAIGAIFDKVFYSAAATMGEQDEMIASIYVRLLTYLVLPILLGTTIIIVLSKEIIYILLGNQWVDNVAILQILSIFILLRIQIGFTDAVFKLKNALYRCTMLRSIYAMSMIIFTIIGTISHGLIGAAVGVNIAVLVNYVLSMGAVRILIPVKYRRLFIATIESIFASCIGGTISWYVAEYLRDIGISSLLIFTIIVVLICVLIIGIYALIFRKSAKKMYFEGRKIITEVF